MAKYTVRLTKKAEKQLDKLPDNKVMPILRAMEQLAVQPRPPGCKKLRGRPAYRIRKGQYRIIYEIFDRELVIDVIAIGHRKEVYE